MSAVWDPWTYRTVTRGERVDPHTDISGWEVEALDGGIGKIDEATYDVGGSYIVVDTGSWIFGKTVMLPAGVIDRLDHANEKVFVHRTKEQIKNAPEFDETGFRDESYRTRLEGYYGPTGPGWRDWDNAIY
jgi:hypothetical protein